jgi:SAM-dependent methyltransferase
MMKPPDALIAQYEEWIYPRPIQDLAAYAAAGGHDLSDPTRMRRKLWPRAIEPHTLDILVAGCGANQAAIIAHANPQHRVLGIDLSSQAIAHHKRLKDRHALSNLELKQIAIEDLASLGQQFDYIISTGVLHHLQDPAQGMAALRDVLAPHGVISVMLYGQHRRTGVYMVQEALRLLDVQRDTAGVAFARNTVDNLPAWHQARSYLGIAPDLDYDAGIVDTVLNARDRAYTVPEILDLVRNTGLAFQGWLDSLFYNPAAAFPADAKIHDRIEDLPAAQQWHVVDLLAQLTGAHRFLVCHPARHAAEIEAAQAVDWLDRVPHLHPDLKMIDNNNGTGQLEREFQHFRLEGHAFDAFKRIDGYTPFRELLVQVVASGGDFQFACALLSQLAEWDHLFCELPLSIQHHQRVIQ